MPYNPGIPNGTVDLDVDYQNLQNNFQELDTQFGVDHIPFSNTSGTPPAGINGYHANIHFNPNSTTTPYVAPTPTAGYGTLWSAAYNDGINDDTALFWLTGGNRSIPMTRNFAPTLASNGATSLSGGLILNWGVNNTAFVSGSTTGTESFTQQYPTSVFAVLTTPLIQNNVSNLPSSQASINISIDSLAVVAPITEFKWQMYTNSDKYKGFFWIAIGI